MSREIQATKCLYGLTGRGFDLKTPNTEQEGGSWEFPGKISEHPPPQPASPELGVHSPPHAIPSVTIPPSLPPLAVDPQDTQAEGWRGVCGRLMAGTEMLHLLQPELHLEQGTTPGSGFI